MVIYVWFEALLNYINSKTGEEFFCTEEGENNDEIVHVIGKEITRFHAIY
jgi:methionyl-tRNA synthetase